MAGTISFSTGSASGIDWTAVADAYIKADSQPITLLQNKIAVWNGAKTAFSQLSSALSDFRSKLQSLKDGSAFGGKKGTISGLAANEVAPFSVDAGSEALVGSYAITVDHLAQAKRVKSAGVSDQYAPVISDGQITIKSGTEDTITIDVSAASGNNSLQAVAEAINSADKGVSASIIKNGTQAMLVVRSKETGTSNDLAITDSTSLHLADAGNVLQNAQDAQIHVDGIEINAQNNNISDAIPGVVLHLASQTTHEVTLGVSEDLEASKQALRDIVTAYNKVNDIFDQELGSASALKASSVGSDGVFRNIQSQLQSMLTAGVTGVATGNIDSLAQLGIQVADRTGKIEFKESIFDDLVDSGRFDEARAVLQSTGSTSDPLVTYFGAASGVTKAGTYAVTVTQAAKQAEVQGGAVTGPLAANENLTITLGTQSHTIALSAGDTLDAVVTKINTALGTAGIAATADNYNGHLRLRSNEFGAAQALSAVSDVAAGGTSTGIGTTPLANTGVDIAGTIGGTAATGLGRDLTGASGTDMEGLMIRVYATDASVAAKGGNFGTVGYSQGISDQFMATIKSITDPFDGAITSATKGYDESIKQANTRITAIQDRLAIKRESMMKQFAAAEQAISSLNQMMASLSSK